MLPKNIISRDSKMERRKLLVKGTPYFALYNSQLQALATQAKAEHKQKLKTILPELKANVQHRQARREKRAVRIIQKAVKAYHKKHFRGTITYHVIVRISGDSRDLRGMVVIHQNTPILDENIRTAIEEHVQNYLTGVKLDRYTTFEYTLHQTGHIAPLHYNLNPMREEQPFNLEINLFGNIVPITSANGECVPTALAKQYPSIANQKRPKIPLPPANSTTEVVMNWVKQYNIRAIAYNIKGEVIAQYTPENPSTTYKVLVYLYYHNHMYLLKNKYLVERPDPTKIEYQDEETLNSHFISLLKQRILPSDVRVKGNTITSFENDGTIYFSNPDYHAIISICEKFMPTDKIPFHTSFSTIMYILEKLYNAPRVVSFLPIKHAKPSCYYNKPQDPNREITTIDKNKAYSNILKDLSYLLSTDIRTAKHEFTNIFTTTSALYIATPTTPHILMPKQDIYAGSHIKFCIQENVQFTIKERLDCHEHPNHFTQIIQDLLRLAPDHAKTIINRAIGCFQSEPKQGEDVNIVCKDDRNPNNTSIPIQDTNEFLEFSRNESVRNITNRRPIAIQIKDDMNRLLYNKMKELDFTIQDIVQIKTDSITFYTDATTKPIYTSKHISGWKYGTYLEARGSVFDDSPPFTTFVQTTPNDNTLITGYAGNGKSHRIAHSDLTDTIILSSKHSAIKQHRANNFNAEVIQKFCCWGPKTGIVIPKESTIIIDECGLLTSEHWDFLYRCFLLGKKIIAYGDFNQLLPTNEVKSFNQPLFINQMFHHQEVMNTNWRNDFTTTYYDSLINGTPEYCLQELIKHSTKLPEEADVIIAYRRDIVDKYNQYMLDFHNKTITDDIPIMCKTNDLRQHNIYNNFTFQSHEFKNTYNIDYTKCIGKLKDDQHFVVAYARTLYNIQGDETDSFYVAPEDYKFFTTGRMAYTLISRLRTHRALTLTE